MLIMPESSNNNYNPDAILNLDDDFLSVECLEKLGLDENPFIDHARDPFLFIDQQIEMSVNILIDYLQNQNSTLALLGEIGVGKTTLLRILLRRGYQHFNFCTLRAKSNSGFAQIEQKLKERWRIPENELDEDIETDEYIKKYIETGKHPVIIIDDAHRLKSYDIDSLLQLKHRVGLQSSQALGLVLAAEPSIQSKLTELEQTNPAATQIYQINARALDANQCEKYIYFRMKKAGATDPNLFSEEQIQEFYSKSQGLPRIINSLARAALSKHCQKETLHEARSPKFAGTPGMRLGLILVALVGVAFVIAAYLKQPKETIELDLEKLQPIQEEVQAEPDKPKTLELAKTTEPQAAEITPKPIVAKPYVAPLVLGPLQIEESPTADEKQKKTEKVIEKTLPFAPDWLLTQDPDAYTIQIVASPNQESLFAFANKNFANKQTAYYQKTNQEKQWYILLYGIFTTRDEALTAIETLPADIQKNQPYPLQIKQIQQVIRP